MPPSDKNLPPSDKRLPPSDKTLPPSDKGFLCFRIFVIQYKTQNTNLQKLSQPQSRILAMCHRLTRGNVRHCYLTLSMMNTLLLMLLFLPLASAMFAKPSGNDQATPQFKAPFSWMNCMHTLVLGDTGHGKHQYPLTVLILIRLCQFRQNIADT